MIQKSGKNAPDTKADAGHNGNPVRFTLASYNIHKGVGLDRKRDPERIMTVLHEIDADIVVLQEVDRRIGARSAVLSRGLLAEHHWQLVPLAMKPASIGWHGNAILVRQGIEIVDAEPIGLPTIEPRGAVCAHLAMGGWNFRVVGMHLDLSGLRRRQQIASVCAHLEERPGPAIMAGDFNEWSGRGGCFREFGKRWNVLRPGRSFHSRRPLAALDRIVISSEWTCHSSAVHQSALSVRASDHLPIKADLELTA
ncbi:endonuclease [Altericroceibacterium spongiae]|uniref:Endonuclease n=1 Tax=Altericroceibacterium spongiae TaxID=2320269 RepID=A0A420EJF4_9SPHN|nr:endonuclease/exonuclease/phosphatase family protein [Altericroceibacterium spongiae]RKF20807.1 endonuclease [Altericroceibacterium spongiae]